MSMQLFLTRNLVWFPVENFRKLYKRSSRGVRVANNFASRSQKYRSSSSQAQMGIPSEMRDVWLQRRKAWVIASPAEDQKISRAKQCTQEGVREGFKAAAIACISSAVPTLVAVRAIPWAKANLNYTAQALIISAATIAAYFITVDKSILKCARRNAQLEESLRSHH